MGGDLFVIAVAVAVRGTPCRRRWMVRPADLVVAYPTLPYPTHGRPAPPYPGLSCALLPTGGRPSLPCSRTVGPTGRDSRDRFAGRRFYSIFGNGGGKDPILFYSRRGVVVEGRPVLAGSPSHRPCPILDRPVPYCLPYPTLPCPVLPWSGRRSLPSTTLPEAGPTGCYPTQGRAVRAAAQTTLAKDSPMDGRSYPSRVTLGTDGPTGRCPTHGRSS